MSRSLRAVALAGMLACLLTTLRQPCGTALAQTRASAWAVPTQLFGTSGRASEAEVVSDPSGVVHVFWAYGAPGMEDEGAGQAIYYMRREGDTWSAPVDILVSPGGRVARMQSVVADQQGYLHVVWSGGNSIFYSRAFGQEADSVRAWTEPVGWPGGTVASEPAIGVDDTGVLYVVWTQGSRGLVFTNSVDGGDSWIEPVTIFEAAGSDELARWGRIAVDALGRVHVVLTHTLSLPTETTGRTDPNYLYYMASSDHGASWSSPVLLASEPDFGEVNVATQGSSEVHVVWNGRAGRHGRYHRWSQDGGQTWSEVVEVLAPSPQSPIGTGGLTGFPALVTDSTGALHLVSATGGGDYYFRWSGGSWSLPVLISPGLDGRGVTGTGSSLEQPSITISEGNKLHVVFHDGFQRIWYTTAVIDAPYEEPRVLPGATATAVGSEETLLAPVEPSSVPTAIGTALVGGPGQEPVKGAIPPAVTGGVVAGVIVLAVVVIRQLRIR